MSEIENILLRDLYKDIPPAPVNKKSGLGSMSGRGTVTTKQEKEAPESAMSNVAEYMRKIFQKQVQEGTSIAASAQDIPFDPVLDDLSTLNSRGYNSDDVLKSSIAKGSVSGTRMRNVKSDTMAEIEGMISQIQKSRETSAPSSDVIKNYLDGVSVEGTLKGQNNSVLSTLEKILGLEDDSTEAKDEGLMSKSGDENVVVEESGDSGLMTRPKAGPTKGLTDDDIGLPDDDNYMGPIADTPEQNLLDRIAFGEGADPEKLKVQAKHNIGTTAYHMVYDYGNTVAPPKAITEMTLSELEVYQKDLINATKGTLPGTTEGTSAVGKYQVLRRSLFGAGGSAASPKAKSWAGKLGLTEDTVYTPAVQEAIGRLALKETGYDNWKKGKKSETAMLQRVADLWASVEGSTAGQGTHTTKKDLEPFLSLVRPISPQAVSRSLRPQARPNTEVASN